MKKSLFAMSLIAAAICMAIGSCEFTSSAEYSVSYEIQKGDDQEGFVITGEPSQMLDISNDLLGYLKSAHINDEDDAEDFDNTMAYAKELLQAVSDSINARIEEMNPKEKGALIDEVSTISDQMEANNPAITKEIERLVKEAKEQGITLSVDL